MPTDRLFFACVVVLVACLLLGGGTRAGFLSDAVLQLAAIPLLLMAMGRLADPGARGNARWPLRFCLALALVPALQLVPLPPGVWTALPNRAELADTLRLLNPDLPWMPASLSPRATWLSLLSLLPPLTVFLGTLLLSYRQRRALSLVLLAVGLVSVFLGLAQVAEGPASNLRFFEVTNPTEAVGFFANRNHFAAFLCTLTMLAAAWAVEASAPPAPLAPERGPFETRRIVPVVAGFTVLVILVAAQAIARSRAGLGLTIVALMGGIGLALCDRRNAAAGVTPSRLLIAATALAVVFAAQFTLYRLLERFEDDPLKDSRVTLARVTSEAARLYMPLGSGVGTFVPVYAMHERPEDAPLDAYANRAHNDVLELWLEGGVVGLGLGAAFLGWLAVRSLQVWRRTASGREIDLSLMRAATVLIALIVVHSLVDYPLRTGAMTAIMAFACGLLVAPAPGGDGHEPVADRRRGAVATARERPAKVHRPADAPISQHPSERWGPDIEWPEEWR
jgi:O-antigen ligase